MFYHFLDKKYQTQNLLLGLRRVIEADWVSIK